MTSKLRKYASCLHTLATAKPGMSKAMIKNADAGLIKCLCECALNILKGNVPLTPSQKQKLKRHKTQLRALVKRSQPLSKKKRTLQKGGFMPAILAPILTSILPTIGSTIGKLISAARGKK